MGPVMTQITTVCCTGTPEHLLPLTSILSAPGTWGLNGAQVLWCKSKPALGGRATQMMCTVVRSLCRSGSVQDGCMEITWGKFGIVSLRKTPFCYLFSPWSVLRCLSPEQMLLFNITLGQWFAAF